jgi:drug/metabolite transporter (DMT)-like permease
MSQPAARYTPHALLLLMIAIWGVSYVVVKDALALCPPLPIVAARFWLAVLCVLPFALRAGRAALWAALWPGCITGAALALGYLLQTFGIQETSASMGGFLAGLIPLLVALGGLLVFGARLGVLGFVGLVMGFAGMGFLIWPTETAGSDNSDTPRGIALQIGSSVSYAAHVLLLSRLGKHAAPLPFCLWQLLVTALAGTLGLLGAGGLSADDGDAPAASLRLVLDLVYLGALATALGIAVQARVQPQIPPMQVALLFATQPLFAALAGFALQGDQLGCVHVAGGALIVAGIVITSCDRVR